MTKVSAGIRHPRRPAFRRSWTKNTEFVLLKPLNQGPNEDPIPMGTIINSNDFRAVSIISMYRRFRIGLSGDPWAEAYMAARMELPPRRQERVEIDAKQAAKEFRAAAVELFETNARTGLPKTLDQVKAKIDTELG